MKTKKILGIALAVCMTMGLTTVPAMAEDKKTFVFGDTTFNAEKHCFVIPIPWKLNHGLPKNMKM